MVLFRSLQENLEMLQGIVVVLEGVNSSVIPTGELGDIQIDANRGLTLVIGGQEQTLRNPRVERVRVSRKTGLITILFVGNLLLRPVTEEEELAPDSVSDRPVSDDAPHPHAG